MNRFQRQVLVALAIIAVVVVAAVPEVVGQKFGDGCLLPRAGGNGLVQPEMFLKSS